MTDPFPFRKRKDDKTLFDEFEDFAKAMRIEDPRITSQDLKDFLREESELKIV
jgi:hypothetical protein